MKAWAESLCLRFVDGDEDRAGAWRILPGGGNTIWERGPGRTPRALLLGEVEEEQVALGQKPGEYGVAEGKGRALRIVNWIRFLGKLVRRSLRNAKAKQALPSARTGSLDGRKGPAWSELRSKAGWWRESGDKWQ